MVDGDIDSKFTVKDLFSPKYSAFEKPFKTCSDIKKVPHDIPIKLILATNGGAAHSCEKIIKVLKKHPAGYIAYICGESYSAGAILSLGANDIVMNNSSYLGKMDMQVQTGSVGYSVIDYHDLDEKYIDTRNIIKVKQCKQLMNYSNELFELILKDHPSYNLIDTIKKHFVFSEYPHCKLFDYNQCKEFGLHVRNPNDDEKEYFTLFDNL